MVGPDVYVFSQHPMCSLGDMVTRNDSIFGRPFLEYLCFFAGNTWPWAYMYFFFISIGLSAASNSIKITGNA